MKNKDFLQELIQELRNIDAPLPLHQRKLRAQLLEMHTRKSAATIRSLTSFRTSLIHLRGVVASKRIISVGVAVTVVGVLLLSLLVFVPSSAKAPARKFIAESSPTTLEVKSAETAQAGDTCENPDACQRNIPDNSDMRATKGAQQTLSPSEAASSINTATGNIKSKPATAEASVSYVAQSTQPGREATVTVPDLNGDSLLSLDVGALLGGGKTNGKKDKASRNEKAPKNKANGP